MRTQATLSISEARKRIFDIAERVQTPSVYYTLTEKGRPKAVILSAEEFESWQETLEVLRDFPDIQKDIEELHRDLRSGAYRKYVPLEEILKKRGLQENPRSRKPYAVSGRTQRARRKRA